MKKPPFNVQDLPWDDVEKIGFSKEGDRQLSKDSLDALLSGRRTELISLKELKADGFRLDQLDAKLSITPDWDGKLKLQIHPIYKAPKFHPFLLQQEIDMLINGQIDVLEKVFQVGDKKKVYNFEYDPETKEFIEYDPEQVVVPEAINTQNLTDKQKKAFRNGEVINLYDGTQVQSRMSDPKGVRADRAALVLSVLLDGGISYLLIRGIKNLLNNQNPQKDERTKGYLQALDEIQQKMKERSQNQEENASEGNQENRGYSKSRAR